MNPLAHAMLLGWPVITLALFGWLPPRRAVLASLIGAYLFLPMSGYNVPGLTTYSKTTAATLSTLLGVLLFDSGRLLSFRPSPLDIPMVLWCFAPAIASITNDLGLYDAGSGFVRQVFAWAIPYFLGRVYFTDLAGLREFAVALFVGGLVYVPFCLFEVRMSPQLHTMVYGWHQHSFAQTIRFGGWRPTVFMQHGLAVSFWMVIATLSGLWLWISGAVRRLVGIPIALLVLPLLVTTILCKSLGALVLGVIGVLVLVACRHFRSGIPLLILTLAPIGYVAVRAPALYDGSHLLTIAEQLGKEDRAKSLRYRLEAEDILSDHAWKQPVFGWGTWMRNRPANFEEDAESVATDGFWIILFGTQGLFGLMAFYALMLLPGIAAWTMLPRVAWSSPAAAGVTVCAITLTLFAADSLFNAMLSPVYLLLSGSLLGTVSSPKFKRLAKAANAKLSEQRPRDRKRLDTLRPLPRTVIRSDR